MYRTALGKICYLTCKLYYTNIYTFIATYFKITYFIELKFLAFVKKIYLQEFMVGANVKCFIDSGGLGLISRLMVQNHGGTVYELPTKTTQIKQFHSDQILTPFLVHLFCKEEW